MRIRQYIRLPVHLVLAADRIPGQFLKDGKFFGEPPGGTGGQDHAHIPSVGLGVGDGGTDVFDRGRSAADQVEHRHQERAPERWAKAFSRALGAGVAWTRWATIARVR